MPLNKETMSKVINLMSANTYTGTARTWAQAKAIVETMDLLPTNTELDALNSASVPTAWGTLAGRTLAQKQDDVKANVVNGYMIYSWPNLTGLK